MRHSSQHYCAAAAGLAAPAELRPPQKGECPELAGGGALKEQTKSNAPNCASPSAKCKRFNTLRARLARDLDSLVVVEAFAAQVGAPS